MYKQVLYVRARRYPQQTKFPTFETINYIHF